MTQPHSQNLSDWAGITGISSQVVSAALVIWKLGCLSSGEAKSGLTCPIPRLLSSPGLLDVEIVCKALSLLWTMDMFDMFFPGTSWDRTWKSNSCHVKQETYYTYTCFIVFEDSIDQLQPCSEISSKSDQGPKSTDLDVRPTSEVDNKGQLPV